MRKTKIICTLGPASDSEEVIEQLILSGMDAARFNFSHGTHETHSALLTRFKRVRDSLGRPVATILDTKGPEIRIRTFGCGRIELNDGDHFTLTTRETEGDTRQVSVTYSNLHQELQSECHILIDDGLVDLEVEEIDGQDIRCRVVTGGPLSNHKSINIPGVSIALPALTDKDRSDIKFAVEQDFDFIAASFVRRAADVEAVRAAAGCGVTLLATVHAASLRDLEDRPIGRDLLSSGGFRRAVVIEGRGKNRRSRVERLP